MSDNRWRNINQEPIPLKQSVLVHTKRGEIAIGIKERDDGDINIDNSFGYDDEGPIYHVTHWMPLPEPPK